MIRRTRGLIVAAWTVLSVLAVFVLGTFSALELESVGAPLSSPAWPNVLGIDRLGRDVLTVTFQGTLWSLGWAAIVLAGSTSIGACLAVVSVRFWGGPLDQAIGLAAEAIRSFPSIVAALLFLLVGVPVALVLVLYFWIPLWRIMRVQTGAQRLRPYVLNAMLFGRSRFAALALHALPNAVRGFRGVLFVVCAEVLSVGAGLEFLGFATPLSQPTLGNLLAESIRLGASYFWVWLPAAVLVSLLTVGLYWAGEREGARQPQGLE